MRWAGLLKSVHNGGLAEGGTSLRYTFTQVSGGGVNTLRFSMRLVMRVAHGFAALNWHSDSEHLLVWVKEMKLRSMQTGMSVQAQMARERHQSAVLNASASVKATHFHWGPSARLITMLAVLSSSDMLTFTLNLYLQVSSLSQTLTQNTLIPKSRQLTYNNAILLLRLINMLFTSIYVHATPFKAFAHGLPIWNNQQCYQTYTAELTSVMGFVNSTVRYMHSLW